jgi:SAM-dependent methyltransferase
MVRKSLEEMRFESAHFWPTGFPVAIKYVPSDLVEFSCERRIAEDSLDHLEPRGTAHDNTHWLPFVAKCESHFGFRDLRYLDLGCAGGGLVFDFAIRRHFAMGLEGSDYSLARKRAEWATIPDNLYTCDITYAFQVTERATGRPMLFDVIGIWDALEHLPEARLPTFFSNVRMHLSPTGLFCGTVSTREARESDSGGNHHATVRPRSWWEELFSRQGFRQSEGVFSFEEYPRGNGIIFPADFQLRPEEGFHFVLSLA